MKPKPKPQFKPGDRFLKYRIVRLLGQGAMGEVYEGADKERHCALKVLRPELLTDPDTVRRMLREGRLASFMKHPNIVNVHEFDQTPDGTVWLRMDLLQGSPLDALIRKQGAMSALRVCKYLHDAASGAHQCHILGMIHRDIKPANLFVTTDEVVKLLDFGLTREVDSAETADGSRPGTPLYMSPEQIRGDRMFPTTDVYSLGASAWEMCTGEPLFGGSSNIHTLFHRHLEVVPPHLSELGVPKPLADVIDRALRKDPRERYARGVELAEAAWSARAQIEKEEPSSETYPGEPPIELLRTRGEDALRFGTGPVSVRRKVAPAPRFAPSPGEPRRSSPMTAAVAYAQTERLPDPTERLPDPTERLPGSPAYPFSVRARASITLRMGSRPSSQASAEPAAIDASDRATMPLGSMPSPFERGDAYRTPIQGAIHSQDRRSRSSVEPTFSPISPARSRGAQHLAGYVGALLVGIGVSLWIARYFVDFRPRSEPAGSPSGSASLPPTPVLASAAEPAPAPLLAPSSPSSSVLPGATPGSAPPSPSPSRPPPAGMPTQRRPSSLIVDPWAPVAKPPPKPRQEIVEPWAPKKK